MSRYEHLHSHRTQLHIVLHFRSIFIFLSFLSDFFSDACRDYSVVEKMSFRIFWLNVSKCYSQELILEKLHRLKVMLQVDDLDNKYQAYIGSTKNEIIHLRAYLRKVLEQPEFRDCLIVLTDVQDENVIKAFDLNCKMLITTRHMEKLEFIAPKAKFTIDIDKGFTSDESLELFKNAFNKKLPDGMTQYVEDFHSTCNGHPFIMSLIARNFRSFPENESSYKKRCEDWKESLGRGGEFIDDQIKMSVEASLKFLSPDEQIRYKKMVIFTDNSDIPFDVLCKIWDTDVRKMEETVRKFAKYSLIDRATSEVCSLHFLHFNFLKQHVSEENQVEYHRHLIAKYEVEKILRERKELDLDFPKDGYFHFFLPYHLVGAKMEDLFDLYLDFGFLEQKMRITKLPNTVGDLSRFVNEITRGDKDRLDFLSQLIDFLTNHEQLIFKSRDVSLLQCALTSSGLVKKMAQEQIEAYGNRVWMDDLDHAENQTQIVQLPEGSKPDLVRFVERGDDKRDCLVTLQNNILLQHISQEYSDVAILYENESPGVVVTDVQIFRGHSFLTLNSDGKLLVYTLRNGWSRKISMIGPHRAVSNQANDKLIQRLDSGTIGNKTTCFNAFKESLPSGIDLIVGTEQGNIKFYQWKISRFEENRHMKIDSNFPDIFRMAHTVHDCIMLMNSRGELRFTDLINNGTLMTNCKWEPLDKPLNIHQGTCTRSGAQVSLCVAERKVLQVTHKQRVLNVLLLEVETVASEEFDDNKILSSTMSCDAKYLILGTSKGIIIIDRHDKDVIFRRSVSDHVLSVDIHRYHDEAMYVLSSVFKDAGHVINLHAFNEYNREEFARMKNLFVGDDLFDIKKSSDVWEMVAIDTKSNIHFRHCANNFTESISKTPFEFQIKKVSCHGEKVIVGCTNGQVFNMNPKTPLMALKGEITYLECFDGAVIASCVSSFKLVGINKEFDGMVTKAYRYKANQLLLVKKDCAIEVIDTTSGDIVWKKQMVADSISSTQTFVNSQVVLGTFPKTDMDLESLAHFVHIWRVDPAAAVETKLIDIESKATASALSADNTVLAIGCMNGNIEVCPTASMEIFFNFCSFQIIDMNRMVRIQRLESHKRTIWNLKFSPWMEPNDPQILMSLSESVNFWDIRSIQNNPMVEVTPRKMSRISGRFTRLPFQLSPSSTEATSLAIQDLSLNDANPWSGKTGPADKPELLSCIKLVAKSAKRIICDDDFTRFVTIDNEGNIYHLRLIRGPSGNQVVVNPNMDLTRLHP